MRSHRLFALPEISTPTAVLVETCACASSSSVHQSAISSLPSAAPALLALADGVPNYSREGANKYWGEGLKLPQLSDEMPSLELQI